MSTTQKKVLDFISIFQSTSNVELFTECACYYFASLLRIRFPLSVLMYDPHQVHFAVKILDTLYDITGIIEHSSDYIEWNDYEREFEEEAEDILRDCIGLERR